MRPFPEILPGWQLAGCPALLRYAAVGAVGTLLQLTLLHLLVLQHVDPDAANVAASLGLVPLGFFLSDAITWAERRGAGRTGVLKTGRLLQFGALVLVRTAISGMVFEVVEPALPYLLAGLVAILASGLLGFVACDRWIFAVRGGETDGHWPPTDRPSAPRRTAGAPVLVPVLASTRRRRPWSR